MSFELFLGRAFNHDNSHFDHYHQSHYYSFIYLLGLDYPILMTCCCYCRHITALYSLYSNILYRQRSTVVLFNLLLSLIALCSYTIAYWSVNLIWWSLSHNIDSIMDKSSKRASSGIKVYKIVLLGEGGVGKSGKYRHCSFVNHAAIVFTICPPFFRIQNFLPRWKLCYNHLPCC